MSFKRKVIKIMSLAAAICLMSTVAWADSIKVIPFPTPLSGSIITPYWQNIATVHALISSTGTTLEPGAQVIATSSSAKITGTLYLEKKSGSSWTRVTSWSVSGTGILAVSKSYSGTAGNTYRSRIVATVNGERVELSSSEESI